MFSTFSRDPEYALFRPIDLPPINYSNSIMIGALHIFHLVMYWKDITRDDFVSSLAICHVQPMRPVLPYIEWMEGVPVG